MENNFKDLYKECIQKLKEGRRPQIKLDDETITHLKNSWPSLELLNTNQAAREDLKEILCLLDNSQTTTDAFDPELLLLLENIKNEKELIFGLSVIQKQTIAHSLKTGKILDYRFFTQFKELLKSTSPELKEWTLRTVESLGPMSLRLKADILAAKPSFFKRLNSHQKNCADIIDYLEAEWKRLGM